MSDFRIVDCNGEVVCPINPGNMEEFIDTLITEQVPNYHDRKPFGLQMQMYDGTWKDVKMKVDIHAI